MGVALTRLTLRWRFGWHEPVLRGIPGSRFPDRRDDDHRPLSRSGLEVCYPDRGKLLKLRAVRDTTAQQLSQRGVRRSPHDIRVKQIT